MRHGHHFVLMKLERWRGERHAVSCANVVTYDLMRAGTYHLESFEPYELKYLKVMVDGGTCELLDLGFREYVNPDTERATFRSSDPVLNRIFEAARETFKHNAVDVFTDCPGRERAGWLCDSFFIGRVAADLCGNTDMERMFFQNYLLPEHFEALPKGMLPMCYPADHPNSNYIPNWAMWFVVQEYLHRSGGVRRLMHSSRAFSNCWRFSNNTKTATACWRNCRPGSLSNGRTLTSWCRMSTIPQT